MPGPGAIHTAALWAAVLVPLAAALGWRRLAPARRRSILVRGGLGFVALLWGLGVWAFLVEPATLAVRHVAIESPAWRGPPLRIGVLSDTHVGAPFVTPARVARVAARLSAERPDLVVFVGDYAGGHEPGTSRSDPARSTILRGVAALDLARAPLGRFAVLGNHDWWFDGPAIETALARAGIPVLANAAARVARPGGAFWVAGLEDFVSPRAPPSAGRALAGVPTDEPVILLSHWPDGFVQAPPRVALTIAAHSHCGQVNLPLLGRLIEPSPGARRWPCGAYVEAGRRLYVTGGLGTSMLPVRFRAAPEIVVITLSAPRAVPFAAAAR